MSHIHAVREDTGKRVCAAVECDGCGLQRPPQSKAPAKAEGWICTGNFILGACTNWDWCPDCAVQALERNCLEDPRR